MIPRMTFHTEYLTFRTPGHREYLNITPQVEAALHKSGIREGMILVSAMHVAAYMGARNILLCGHDCGSLDGELTFTGYYDAPLKDTMTYWRLLNRFGEQTMAVRDKLQEVYGCRVYSLNPFVNFALEGHVYRREP